MTGRADSVTRSPEQVLVILGRGLHLSRPANTQPTESVAQLESVARTWALSQDRSVMSEAHPSDRDLREAAARGAEEARRRGEAAAMRRTELAQALAGHEHGKHDAVERAERAASEAVARSAGAHESSAEAHQAAAHLYDRAAQLAERHGHGDEASQYREAAATAREDAQLAVRSAQEDRGRLGQKIE